MRFSCVIFLFWISSIQAERQPENIINITNFSNGSLSGWTEKEFLGKTNYKIITLDDKAVLQADSHQVASGLFKKIKIDLTKTPYLNWSWRAENLLEGIDEKSKQGDDYVARLYVIKNNRLFFWKTQALNYVWSSNQEKFSHWDNAYTSQAKMLAIRGRDERGNNSSTQKWFTEKRHVREDFKRLFGVDIDTIDGIAIMTDTDNSKLSARAYYGDIYFSAE